MSSTALPDALHDVILHVDKLINNLTFLMELLSHNTSKHWAAWANLKMSVVHFRVTDCHKPQREKSILSTMEKHKESFALHQNKNKKKTFWIPLHGQFLSAELQITAASLRWGLSGIYSIFTLLLLQRDQEWSSQIYSLVLSPTSRSRDQSK